MEKINQTGFSIVVVLLALAVVGLAAFAVLRIKNSEVPDQPAVTSQSAVPETIESKEDLQQASDALDETAIDEGMNSDQLDSDIDSLL